MDRRLAEAQSLTRVRRGDPVDKELEAGSRAHYEDPAYYTKTYKKRADDVAFYVGLAEKHAVGKKGRGSVLEYGAGNGRIALPVARAGFSVAGLDLSRPMLDDFEASLRAEPPAVRRRVTLRHADMRDARLGRRFYLVICPFNAFLHLYTRTDVERFLARVRDHLAPGGVFALDVSIPNPHELVRDPNRAYVCPAFSLSGDRRHDPLHRALRLRPARQILFVTMEFEPEGRPKDAWVAPLAHRQFYPQELEALLHYNGFAIEDAWGDYQGGKLDRYSEIMALTARARTTARK